MNFKQARSLAGISQVEIAEKIRTSQAAISKIEKGLTFPRNETREKIEAILGEIDWLSTRLSGMDTSRFRSNEESRPENGPEESIMAYIHDFVKSGGKPSEWAVRCTFLRKFIDQFEKTLFENRAKREAKYRQTVK
jgi:transcriptional regulator with XRE-family HTH domain